MSHKNSKNKQNQNKGYNQNQQTNSSAEDSLMSNKYQNNSNAQE